MPSDPGDSGAQRRALAGMRKGEGERGVSEKRFRVSRTFRYVPIRACPHLGERAQEAKNFCLLAALYTIRDRCNRSIDRIGSLCSHVAERLDGKRSNVSIYICLLSCLPVRLCNHRILTKENSFAHRRLVLRSRALRARDTCHLVFFLPPPHFTARFTSFPIKALCILLYTFSSLVPSTPFLSLFLSLSSLFLASPTPPPFLDDGDCPL